MKCLRKGDLLLDSEGDVWEWLGDELPGELVSGRDWLRTVAGPYVRMKRGTTIMPWQHPEPNSSAQRYGPFRRLLIGDEVAP